MTEDELYNKLLSLGAQRELIHKKHEGKFNMFTKDDYEYPQEDKDALESIANKERELVGIDGLSMLTLPLLVKLVCKVVSTTR